MLRGFASSLLLAVIIAGSSCSVAEIEEPLIFSPDSFVLEGSTWKLTDCPHIPYLIINGQTEPGATLWIDDGKVEIADDGTFNAVVKLRREGMNEIVLLAQDNAGNEVTLRRSTFVEVY